MQACHTDTKFEPSGKSQSADIPTEEVSFAAGGEAVLRRGSQGAQGSTEEVVRATGDEVVCGLET